MNHELRDRVMSAIDHVHEKWAGLIDEEWSPKSLTSPCLLVLATDGIEPHEVAIGSVLHAQLVVNLKMASEWGWGFGDAIHALRDAENRIEQNGMAYIKETLAILEDEFDRTSPPLDRKDLANSPVYQALKQEFSNSVRYKLAGPADDLPDVPLHEDDACEARIEQVIFALLGQIETGHNTVLNPESGDIRSELDMLPVMSVEGSRFVVTVTNGGQQYRAAMLFNSQELALAAKENTDLHMAMIWKLAGLMDSEEALAMIEQLPFKFSEETETFLEKHDLTTEEVSEIIIQSARGRLTLH